MLEILGIKRLNQLQIKSYQVNYFFFETSTNLDEGGEDDQEYRLSGGNLMKGFVVNGIAKLRAAIDNVKRAKMKGGMDNAYKTTHEKNTDNPTIVSSKANKYT